MHCAFFDSDHMHVTNSSFGPDNTCQTAQEDLVVFRANSTSIDDVGFDHVTFATVTAPPDFQCGSGKHVDSMQGYGVSNLVVSNSVFYGCPGQCVIFRPFAGGVPGPLTFENNVFNQPQDPGGALSLGTSSAGDACNGRVLVQNNTFATGANMNGGYTIGNELLDGDQEQHLHRIVLLQPDRQPSTATPTTCSGRVARRAERALRHARPHSSAP